MKHHPSARFVRLFFAVIFGASMGFFFLVAAPAAESSLFHTYLQQYKGILVKTNEFAARQTLKELSSGFETYAQQHQGAYPADEDAVVSLYPSYFKGIPMNGKVIKGYSYLVDCTPQSYRIQAVPTHCGVMGTKVFSVNTRGLFEDTPCEAYIAKQEELQTAAASSEKVPESGMEVQRDSMGSAAENTPEDVQGLSEYSSEKNGYYIRVPDDWMIVERKDFRRIDPSFSDSDAEILLIQKEGKGWGILTATAIDSSFFNFAQAKQGLVDNLKSQQQPIVADTLNFDYGEGGFEVQWASLQDDHSHRYMILFAMYHNGTGIQIMGWSLVDNSKKIFADLKEIMGSIVAQEKP